MVGSPPPAPVPYPALATPGTELPRHYAGCFACGELEGGLRMRFTVVDERTVRGRFVVEPHHQGSPGLAHGGVLAAAFDEALGALQSFYGEPAVTASLSTEYVHPVPVGAVLHLECRVERREGRKLWTSGVGRLHTPDGPTAVRSEALFVFVDPAHFSRHTAADGAA